MMKDKTPTKDDLIAAERFGQVKAEHIWKSHLDDQMADAERKAWDSLARYKFQMFGYWAAIWVHLNALHDVKRANPFRAAVKLAKEMTSQRTKDGGNGSNDRRD